jgi:hypothetical protein
MNGAAGAGRPQLWDLSEQRRRSARSAAFGVAYFAKPPSGPFRVVMPKSGWQTNLETRMGAYKAGRAAHR